MQPLITAQIKKPLRVVKSNYNVDPVSWSRVITADIYENYDFSYYCGKVLRELLEDISIDYFIHIIQFDVDGTGEGKMIDLGEFSDKTMIPYRLYTYKIHKIHYSVDSNTIAIELK